MSALRIIQVGLPWNYHGFDAATQEMVRTGLEKGREVMKHAGYDNYSTYDVTPEEGPAKLIDFLGKEHVDGVVIGYGIRGIKEHTAFFELLVNVVHTHAPHVKFMFNTSPDTAVDAAKRQFPIK